jgi:hypothetical protein
MLTFLKERSYDIVKMFVYQIALSLFGLSLALATGSRSASADLATYQPSALQIVTGIFSIAFYLFLVCYFMWGLGSKDASHLERGEKGYTRLTGLYMALAASTVNFLVAVCIMLGNLLSHVPFFSNLGGGAAVVGLLTQGMYMGLLSIRVNGDPLNSIWFVWFITMIPLIVSAALAYYAGSRDFHLFKTKPPKNM